MYCLPFSADTSRPTTSVIVVGALAQKEPTQKGRTLLREDKYLSAAFASFFCLPAAGAAPWEPMSFSSSSFFSALRWPFAYSLRMRCESAASLTALKLCCARPLSLSNFCFSSAPEVAFCLQLADAVQARTRSVGSSFGLKLGQRAPAT